MGRSFIFVGVTTGQSSMMRIFPRWRDLLGLGPDIELAGWDFPIGAPTDRYRVAMERVLADPGIVGGLVTTHKLDLYRAAWDLFAEVNDDARLLGEVSCFAVRNHRLLGWAKDPTAAGRSLDEVLGRNYFAERDGEVLCLGAGGAGQAITLMLLASDRPRPKRIVVTDISEERLRSLQEMHRRVGEAEGLEYLAVTTPMDGDRLVEDLPAGSLVINATGMGKDRSGSPLSDAVRFPPRAIAWDLNYRGSLDFLRQARSQPDDLHVRVEDGWRYFIHGWTGVIEEVFQRPIGPADLEALSAAAAFARPPVIGPHAT